MTEPQLIVSYERKYSDGNYGSEGLALSITVPFATEERITDEVTLDYADALRRVVLSFLSAPGHSERVIWAAKRELNPPPPIAVPSRPDRAPVELEDMPF